MLSTNSLNANCLTADTTISNPKIVHFLKNQGLVFEDKQSEELDEFVDLLLFESALNELLSEDDDEGEEEEEFDDDDYDDDEDFDDEDYDDDDDDFDDEDDFDDDGEWEEEEEWDEDEEE